MIGCRDNQSARAWLAAGRCTARFGNQRRGLGAQLRFRRGTTFPGNPPALLWTLLVLLMLGALSPKPSVARDVIGIDPAAAEAGAAADDMVRALNAAPEYVQTISGPAVQVMARGISRALARLQSAPAPMIDPSLVYDLAFLSDVARAVTDALTVGPSQISSQSGRDREPRIERLAAAAAERLAKINLAIDRWIERNRNAVIDVQADAGAIRVTSIDRRLYDGVRYGAVALALFGLLAVGVQLLRMSRERVDTSTRFRRARALAPLAVSALASFFAICLVLSVRPETLAALSAEVRVQPQEHPCERLQAQRDRLVLAEELDSRDLVEALKRRMRPAAQDCLGLPSQTATVEAIERLAARVASGPTIPPPLEPADLAAAPEDFRLSTLDAEATPPAPAAGPPAPAEADAPTQVPAGIRASDQPPDGSRPEMPAPEAGATTDQTAAIDTPSEATQGNGTATAPAASSSPSPEPAPELFVATTALNYRTAPSTDAPRLGILAPGDQVAKLSEDAGWAEIRLGDGRQAFVASRFLEPAP
jgi:hypothetical protein